MTPIRAGVDAQLGIVDEVTYGTAVVVTRFLEFVSESMQGGPAHRDVQLAGLGRSRHLRDDRIRTYPASVDGGVQFELLDTNFGLLLEHMFGAVATAGAGPDFRHTFTPDDAAGGFGKSFTMQIGKPDISGVVQPFTYAGCTVPSFDMSSAIGDPLVIDANIHAQSVVTSIALASKSYPTDARPFIFVDGTLSVGASNVPLRAFKMTVDHGLEVERMLLGSGLVSEPIAASPFVLTGELDTEFQDLTDFTAWAAGTQAQMILTFDSERTLGAVTYTLVVTIPLTKYTGSLPVVGGPGIVQQPLPFVGLKNAASAIISAEYQTSDALP